MMMSASGAMPTNDASEPPATCVPPAAIAVTWVPWPTQSLCRKSSGSAGYTEVLSAVSMAVVSNSTPYV